MQSKIEFARLLDDLGLPQPKWQLVDSPDELAEWPALFYLKRAFSTAGTGVRRVTKAGGSAVAFESLRAGGNGGALMAQAAARGEYAQVQALFDHGRLLAAHTSAQTAVGIGPSAAGRVSVDHAFARRDVATVGERLRWHGGLTLDYFFTPLLEDLLSAVPLGVVAVRTVISPASAERLATAVVRDYSVTPWAVEQVA